MALWAAVARLASPVTAHRPDRAAHGLAGADLRLPARDGLQSRHRRPCRGSGERASDLVVPLLASQAQPAFPRARGRVTDRAWVGFERMSAMPMVSPLPAIVAPRLSAKLLTADATRLLELKVAELLQPRDEFVRLMGRANSAVVT